MERWLPIVGYEGHYEVSNHGRVRSLDRWALMGPKKTTPKLLRGKVLQPVLQSTGYFTVTLHRQGQRNQQGIHRLVALSFIGPPPAGKPFVCHGDGDSINNHVENLRWDTPSANMLDAIKHGTAGGEAHPLATLTEAQVAQVKTDLLFGRGTPQSIARRYSTTARVIHEIKLGNTWRNVCPAM
jgi:hypothetical protein